MTIWSGARISIEYGIFMSLGDTAAKSYSFLGNKNPSAHCGAPVRRKFQVRSSEWTLDRFDRTLQVSEGLETVTPTWFLLEAG
jgi:hypothetical protein